MPAAENHAVFVIYIYVGPAAKPQAAPIAPESRRVVEGKLMFYCELGERAGQTGTATATTAARDPLQTIFNCNG
jgi:hypothetical protein